MSLIGRGGASGGASSGGMPSGYEYKVDAGSGSLQLWKGAELIATQNSDGSWFKSSVSTGVGSLHLGGGDSSDPAHSVSSIGQNCGFKNEAFNATPESAVVWFPPWQGLTADIGTEYPATYLKFEALQTALAPNGIAVDTEALYDFTTTMTANTCIASVTTKAREAYSGKITNIIRSHPKGVDLHVSSRAITVTSGQEFTIEYPALYFARNGDQLRLIMQKEDGQPLKVWRGSMNSKPWRTLRARVFSDVRLDEKATQSVDGLMRKEDKLKLDNTPQGDVTTEYFRSFDFQYAPPVAGAVINDITFSSVTIQQNALSSEAGHFGVMSYKTNGTSGGYFSGVIASNLYPIGSELSIVAYLKTPPSLAAGQVTSVGTLINTNSLLNRSGLIIENDKAFGGSVINGTATETGSTYTLAVDTWYIAKYELLADDKFKVTLFSDAGVQLYTYNSTGTTYRGTIASTWFGIKQQATSTASNVEMPKIDLIEFKAKVNSTRVKV